MTETVALHRTQVPENDQQSTTVRRHERVGGGGSPVQVRQQSKITPEPQAERTENLSSKPRRHSAVNRNSYVGMQ